MDELEIGFHTARPYWGQGLATEAALACRDHAFDTLDKQRVISWIKHGNTSSRRVAEKIGMRFEKEVRNELGSLSVIYSMEPEDRKK